MINLRLIEIRDTVLGTEGVEEEGYGVSPPRWTRRSGERRKLPH